MNIRTWSFVAAVSGLALACNGLIALDGYHTCVDQPEQCADGGSADADVRAETSVDGGNPCSSYSQCSGGTPICSGTKCVAPVKLAQGSSAFACVLLSDGKVMCWGPNGSGQLGQNNQIPSKAPVIVQALSDATQVALGFGVGCALTKVGEVYCWGDGAHGVVPGGLSFNGLPKLITLPSKATWIALGSGNENVACALLDQGDIFCWGDKVPGQPTGVKVQPTAVSPKPTAPIEVHADSAAVCARTATGKLECWGENDRCTFGDGTTSGAHALTDVGAFDALSYGEEHQCLHDGTAIRCWGLDDCGKITGKDVGCGTYPQVPDPISPALSGSIRSVSAAGLNTCIALTNGHARCWGINSHGTGGIGAIGPTNVPGDDVRTVDQATLTGVTDIAVHRQFACVLANGSLYCWGENGGAIGPVAGDSAYASLVPWP